MPYQTHVRLDDDLEAAVRAYAAEYRISMSAAIRILVLQGLKAEKAMTAETAGDKP